MEDTGPGGSLGDWLRLRFGGGKRAPRDVKFGREQGSATAGHDNTLTPTRRPFSFTLFLNREINLNLLCTYS